MVQHLLLTVVAAPLLVVSAPIPTLLRGSAARSLRRRGSAACAFRRPRRAVPWAILHVVVLWSWHAAALYEAALSNDLLHRLEHVSFLVTALLVVGGDPLPPGARASACSCSSGCPCRVACSAR